MTINLFTALGGETWRIRRFPLEEDKRWSAFNPSIGYSPEEGYVVLFRSSNYFFDPKTGETVATIGSRVKNRMFLANLDDSWRIIDSTQREIDFSECGNFLRGPEDGRLYWRDGAWEITAVMREPHITNDIPRIGTFRLDGSKATLTRLHTSGELQPMEKNWMPFYKKPEDADFVYSAISVYKEGYGKINRRKPSELAGANVRGGSCLWPLHDGKNLAIVHEAEQEQVIRYSNRRFGYIARTEREYYHRFALYSENGTLLKLSDRFKLSDAKIEFAAGLVVAKDEIVISFGYKDVAAYLGKIKLDAVIKMLKEV